MEVRQICKDPGMANPHLSEQFPFAAVNSLGYGAMQLAGIVVLALAGCTTPDGNQQVGTCEVIDGVDVWKGPPGRPYVVIADVNRDAADSSTSFRDEEASIADEARQRHADAVIVVDAVMAVSRIDLASGRPVMAPKVASELIRYQ